MAPPTGFARWLFGYSNGAEIKGKAIEQEQLSCHFVPKFDEVTDREQRSKISDNAGQRADDAQLGAIVAVIAIECVTDEATVARLVRFPAAKQPDLSLELCRRGGNERNAERQRGVGALTHHSVSIHE